MLRGGKTIAISCKYIHLPFALIQCCNVNALSVTHIDSNKHRMPFTDQAK